MPSSHHSKKVNFETNSQAILNEKNPQEYAQFFEKGLSEQVVITISKRKKEPQWLQTLRLKALKQFNRLEYPSWGPDLSGLDVDQIRYFASASDQSHAKTWEEVDPKIKQTFERLKIPETERTMLAGVGAQYESENIYHNLKPKWEKKGIIFEDFDKAVHRYPTLIKEYFSRCIPITDHKFAALHYAVFSGGTFLWVPENTIIDEPLQAYFRMNAQNQGQFEHTLIILEKGAKAHYIEGCSAPKYGSQSLHAGGVEIFVKEKASLRYSSVENWSKDTFNLNTKRALVHDQASVEWVGGNLGAGITMLYPCSILLGEGAKATHLGVAVATDNQTQDTGAKIIISNKNCRANVISKSIAKDGGNNIYRGLVEVNKNGTDALVSVQCDALMLDNQSRAKAIPQIICKNKTASVFHEASAGRIAPDVLLYFASRGINEEKAKGMIVNGFMDQVVKNLPFEYASEMNRLIEMEMEGDLLQQKIVKHSS